LIWCCYRREPRHNAAETTRFIPAQSAARLGGRFCKAAPRAQGAPSPQMPVAILWSGKPRLHPFRSWHPHGACFDRHFWSHAAPRVARLFYNGLSPVGCRRRPRYPPLRSRGGARHHVLYDPAAVPSGRRVLVDQGGRPTDPTDGWHRCAAEPRRLLFCHAMALT